MGKDACHLPFEWLYLRGGLLACSQRTLFPISNVALQTKSPSVWMTKLFYGGVLFLVIQKGFWMTILMKDVIQNVKSTESFSETVIYYI